MLERLVTGIALLLVKALLEYGRDEIYHSIRDSMKQGFISRELLCDTPVYTLEYQPRTAKQRVADAALLKDLRVKLEVLDNARWNDEQDAIHDALKAFQAAVQGGAM